MAYLGKAKPESGSGGGQIIQYEVVPTAGIDYLGRIIQYIGVTDSSYTNGYFYKCVAEGTYTTSVTFENEKIACSGANFLAFLQRIAPTTFDQVVTGTMTYYTAADLWSFYGYDVDGEQVAHYQQYTDDFEDEGFTFTGEFEDEETISLVCTTTASYTYHWARVNVQPFDEHNKGWFANASALRTAYPTAQNGDYAIVGATDSVWVWDSDTSDWKDTHSAGTVQSVNGQTGVVVLDAEDINALVGSTTDTVQNHLVSLRNDLGDLGDDVDALETTVAGKQDTLTAGNNITISGSTISATDTTYTAGTGISIVDNVISNTQTSAEWGNITGTLSSQTDLQTALNGKQDTLTAGSNITISSNTISATDTTYTAGNGLSLVGGGFEIDETVVATQTDLSTGLATKQNTLTAGTNITIENNVISATGGSSYTAGDRITITNNTISADIQYGAQFVDWSEQ